VKDLAKTLLMPAAITNLEFPAARTSSHVLLEVDAKDFGIYENELFGPIAIIVKTNSTKQSVDLAKEMAVKHGAITCLAYTTSDDVAALIEEEMESAFTPVSFNFVGGVFVNQHAAFSDFHVTGGNPAGNASFSNPEYVNKRFVWVGHRKLS
jgi:acyl-CoA reductase-like NAD-dependent aldehyde dehydrogenase